MYFGIVPIPAIVLQQGFLLAKPNSLVKHRTHERLASEQPRLIEVDAAGYHATA